MALRTAVIVVSCNGLNLLRENLGSLQCQTLPFARILVIDNGSRDGTARFIDQQSGVDLIASKVNRGFAGGANIGIRVAMEDPSIDAIALVNNDVLLAPDWHKAAAKALLMDAAFGSCATCLLKESDPDRIDSTGIEWTAPGLADNYRTGQPAPDPDSPVEEVFGACGAAALFRKAFFEGIGLFDESLFAYQEDVDLALRGRAAGWLCVSALAARGIHRGLASNRRFPLGGTYADYHNTRNRLYVLVKSLPGFVWKEQWKRILGSQLRLWLQSFRQRRGLAVTSGLLHAFLRLPRALRQRRRIRPVKSGDRFEQQMVGVEN